MLSWQLSGCGRPIRLRIQQVFTGVVGVIGVCLFGGMPAKASPRLQTWQFDTGQNRFMFTTEGGVQPQVSLGQNPRRLIIDLPGVVTDEAVADQFIGGAVQAVKVMQVDARTTRMVLELDPNYTIDPQQVRVWGLTEAQWVVQLPSLSPNPLPPATWATTPPPGRNSGLREEAPQASAAPANLQTKALHRAGPHSLHPQASPTQETPQAVPPRLTSPPISPTVSVSPPPLSPLPPHLAVARPSSSLAPGAAPHSNPLPPLLSRNQVIYAPVGPTGTIIQGVQVTAQGFFIPLAGTMPQVQVYRTRDANATRQIVIDVLNAAIPPQITPDTLPANRYGISRWAITQFSTLPPAVRLTLNLDQASPDWQVSPVAGGLVLTPIGMVAQQIATTPTTVVLPVLHTTPPQTSPQPLGMATPIAQTTAPLPQRGQVLVMLDPGHGGADPGAIGIGGLQEKAVVIAVSHHVANALRSQGIQVQMTRQGDETLDLQPRVDRAAAANATVFVSIHANAVNMQRPEVNGLETYYFSETGLTLANAIHRRVMASVSMNDRGVKQARFFVLRRTTMPSALIEIGFVTGALDAPKLRDPQWQAQMGQAIAQGILDYFQGGGR